ncbi:hypothetical protein [Methylosinus sp. LW3]|uniref:hypothetical protein n=1 Tax=Methylosinus sp. LW3 TaxID=107635 RepID=UPI000465AA71|nr:hypothetical protein [Methylosinus sp. LW3]
MPTEPENSSHKPDPTSASEDRRVDPPNAQHVEELRAELNGAMNPRERKAISEELTRARDHLSTVDLLARLEEHRPQIEARDPQLAARIDRVAETFLDNPHERLSDPKFKTDLAYVLQDAEKLVEPLRVDRDLRDELTQLAASSPGLKNEQMRSLLQKTETLDDPDLVARLREKAAEIAAKSNQATKAVQGEIFALSFEVLEAKRREPAAAPSASSPIGSEPATAKPSVGDAEPPSPPSKPAADAGAVAARQAEIEAFGDPAASSRSVTSSRPSPDPAGQSEAESSRTSPAAADELPHTAPVASTAAPSEANEASAAEPAERAADIQSAPADKAKIEIAAFDASSPTPARPSTTSEPVQDVANPEPKSPQAPSSQTPAPAAGGAAAASTPANDDRNLAASAARPASPATSPKAPEPPEPDETDPTTKHDVQIVQEKLVVGGVFGKALGVVGRSASAIGRILEAATPSAQAALQQGAQQPRESSAREKQANTEDVQRRLQNFENTRMQSKRNDSMLYAANTSGRAALDAMGALRDAPGASILNRIQDAAANNKGGMNAVIEGMKAGGPFEGLRKELKAAIGQNNSFGAAYDRAAEALTQYGVDRERIVLALASHPNHSNWNEHFKKLDAAVGEAASALPKKEGDGSMLEHLGEKAREIVEKVLEKIKAVFHRDPEARPSPSPGP